MIYILVLTYLLNPWCRVLLEQLTGLQLIKKFPAFHGTRRFITALTSVRQLSLSWASPIQSIYSHLTSWRSILILSTHLRLGLPSGLFPSGFPTKTLYTPCPRPYAPHGPHFIPDHFQKYLDSVRYGLFVCFQQFTTYSKFLIFSFSNKLTHYAIKCFTKVACVRAC